MEIWKGVPGHEDVYEISNLGKIRSFKKNRERILKLSKNTNGYLHVGLLKDNKKHCWLLHRLLATIFIPNPENKPFINHIDGNKLNNSMCNLEWCTQKENVNHAWSKGINKISEHQKILLKNRFSIKVIDEASGTIYDSIKAAAEHIGMNKTTLGFQLRGKFKNKTNLRIYGKTI